MATSCVWCSAIWCVLRHSQAWLQHAIVQVARAFSCHPAVLSSLNTSCRAARNTDSAGARLARHPARPRPRRVSPTALPKRGRPRGGALSTCQSQSFVNPTTVRLIQNPPVPRCSEPLSRFGAASRKTPAEIPQARAFGSLEHLLSLFN